MVYLLDISAYLVKFMSAADNTRVKLRKDYKDGATLERHTRLQLPQNCSCIALNYIRNGKQLPETFLSPIFIVLSTVLSWYCFMSVMFPASLNILPQFLKAKLHLSVSVHLCPFTCVRAPMSVYPCP